ncbi:MAG: tandem-95 repeat protein, partial [Chloroflexi bacterium]|nr:tandem-95 repeat protein [Chloroflexota bacterium]
ISVSGPLHGQAVLEGDNVRYTPNANYFGDDLFGYTVRDSGGRTDSALVRVTVQPVNDPPDAQDDTASTAAGAKVTVDVLANDSDIEGDPLTIVRLGTPSQGTATIQGRNVLYWAEVWASGTDVFTYTLSDGELEDTATVSVLISEAQAALLYLPFVRQRWPDTFVLWGRVSTEAGGSIPDALVSVRDGPSTRTD